MKKLYISMGVVWVVFFTFAMPAMALQEITGRIVDAQNGKPLAHASIKIQGTSRGTTTNSSGYFSLEINRNSATLVVSYVGYHTKTVEVAQNVTDLYITLQPAENELQRLVVKGTAGLEKQLLRTPGSVDILSASEMNRSNQVFPQQSLNLLPNVQMEVRNGTSQSHIVIRGVGTYSRFNIRGVKAYLNGISLTAADGTTSLDFIDFTTLGRMEVIKGPNAGLYGANTGGVLFLFTKKPYYNSSALKQSLMLGSYGLLRTNTTVKTGGDRSRFYLNYGYQGYSGYRDHSESTKNFFTLTGEIQPSNHRKISTLILYTTRDDKAAGELNYNNYHQNPRQAFFVYQNKDIGAKEKVFLASLGQTYYFSPDFFNKTSVYTVHSFLKLPIEPFFKRTQDRRFGGRSVFTYHTGSTEWTFGTEYIHDFIIDRHYQISSEGIQGAITTDNELTLQQYSLFGQANFAFSDRTRLTIGAGLNGAHYDISDLFQDDTNFSGDRTFDLVFSPRIAILHQLDAKNSIYLNAGSGFVPPTIGEISVRDGSVNTDVNAEKSYNLDIGARGNIIDSRLHYDISLFVLIRKDTFIPRQKNGFTYYVNAGQVTNKGLGISLIYDLVTPEKTGGWGVRSFLNYGYIHARFTNYEAAGNDYSGNEVTGIPPHQLAAGIDITTRFGGYAHVTFNFIDERPITDANTVYDDSYSLFNAKLGMKRMLANHISLDLYAGINNVFDTLYSPVLALNQQPHGSNPPRYFNPATGRNVFGGVSIGYHF